MSWVQLLVCLAAASFAEGNVEGTGGNAWGSQLPDLRNAVNTEARGESVRCVDKVVMETRTEFNQTIECEHSYDRRCYSSLSTVFSPTQEEECRENFVKNCFIESTKGAVNVTIQLCRKPLVRDCDVTDSEERICSTQYETECETSNHEHEVEDDVPECRTVAEETCQDVTEGYTTVQKCDKVEKEVCTVKKEKRRKVTPETKCNKVPVELCGPSGCGYREGAEECRNKVKTVVFDKPEEICDIEPRRVCKFVTKLVPQLKEVETCIDVPKEICNRVDKFPRLVEYPVLTKWCYKYTPTCPDTCTEAAQNGVCLPECESYGPECCPKPVCPAKCEQAAIEGSCLAECEEFADLPGCKCEQKCPEKCVAAATSGECNPECEQFEDLEGCKCTRRCPDVCQPYIESGECQDLPSKCQEYRDLPDCLCQQVCPSKCVEAAESNNCTVFDNIGCGQFSGIPECQCQPIEVVTEVLSEPAICPQKCLEAAAEGECLADCKIYAASVECCAPTCPAKCTSSKRRRDSCASGGVPECKDIPGCCPELYSVLFGDVFFQTTN